MTPELRAYQEFVKLAEAAERCRQLFASARVPLPLPLKRFFEGNSEQETIEIQVPVMPAPPRPGAAAADWIWVDVKRCTPSSLILGLLSAKDIVMNVGDIVNSVQRLRGEDVNPGTIANIGTRFDREGVIARSDDGWELIDKNRSLTLSHGLLWGPVPNFEKSEVASFRREVILHILRTHRDGLQVMQVTRLLEEGCEWLTADLPKSKDLVKMDLATLSKEGRVRKSGGKSGKYRPVET